MKRLILALAVALALPSVGRAEWLSAVVTNPIASQMLVEAIATEEQAINFCTFASSSVNATLRVQHRNAADDTTLREQLIPVLGGTLSTEFCVRSDEGLTLLNGERVRIINNAVVVGNVSVSLKSPIH